MTVSRAAEGEWSPGADAFSSDFGECVTILAFLALRAGVRGGESCSGIGGQVKVLYLEAMGADTECDARCWAKDKGVGCGALEMRLPVLV